MYRELVEVLCMEIKSTLVTLSAIILASFSITKANPHAIEWGQISDSAPARFGHKCAYDTARNTVVLFGGIDSLGTYPADVWEWSGTSWTQSQAPGPEGRNGHGLCYDDSAQLTILFGGKDENDTYLNDFWTWDGAQWQQIEAGTPSPRAYFAMTFDSVRNTIILFGRVGPDSAYGDTWEWDGEAWNQAALAGPAPRLKAGFGYDRFEQYAVLFGGQPALDAIPYIDTWRWNGTAWNEVTTDGNPGPRVGFSAIHESFMLSLLVFGGHSFTSPDSFFSDTWTNYGQFWNRVFMTHEPTARVDAELVACGQPYSILLIGGRNSTGVLHDIWAFPYFYPDYYPGDINGNFVANGLDVVYGVSYFRGGPPPPVDLGYICVPFAPFYAAGDVNGNCAFNGIDISYFVNYLKGVYPQLLYCPNCPP